MRRCKVQARAITVYIGFVKQCPPNLGFCRIEFCTKVTVFNCTMPKLTL